MQGRRELGKGESAPLLGGADTNTSVAGPVKSHRLPHQHYAKKGGGDARCPASVHKSESPTFANARGRGGADLGAPAHAPDDHLHLPSATRLPFRHPTSHSRTSRIIRPLRTAASLTFHAPSPAHPGHRAPTGFTPCPVPIARSRTQPIPNPARQPPDWVRSRGGPLRTAQSGAKQGQLQPCMQWRVEGDA